MAERKPPKPLSALEEAKARARHAQEMRTGAKVAHLAAPRLSAPYVRVAHPGRSLSNVLSRRALNAVTSGWSAARALATTSTSGRIPGLAIRANSAVRKALGAPIRRGMASLAGVAGASMGRGFTAGERRPFSARAYALPAANHTRKSPKRAKSANKAKGKSKSKSKPHSA